MTAKRPTEVNFNMVAVKKFSLAPVKNLFPALPLSIRCRHTSTSPHPVSNSLLLVFKRDERKGKGRDKDRCSLKRMFVVGVT